MPSGASLNTATLLLEVEQYVDRESLDWFAVPYVVALLNTWVKPPMPWLSLPGVGTLCHALLGDAWCAMFLPDVPDIVGGYDDDHDIGSGIDALIRQEQPSCMQELCPEQETDRRGAVPLPDLMMVYS